MLRKSLDKHKETNGQVEQPVPEQPIINKIEVVEEVQQPEEKEPAVSEESFEYNPPYQNPHRNDNTNFRPNTNIVDISHRRDFSSESDSPSPVRKPDEDLVRRRRPVIPDREPVIPSRPSRGRVRDIAPRRDYDYAGSRTAAQRGPTRSAYVDHQTLDRFSKPDNRYSADVDREEKPVSNKPIRIGGRRSESKWQGRSLVP